MKIVSAGEMRDIDRATSERFGVPSLTLMENAGTSVADHVLGVMRSRTGSSVFCGKGNNGGDGFVVARKLGEQGKNVKVILLVDPAELRGDAAAMFARLPVSATVVRSSSELTGVRQRLSADLYVDAILGTGFKPPVSGLYADAIQFVNASSVRVVAVDIPSGADADAMSSQDASQQGSIARADSIVTFTAPRPAHVFSQLTSGPTVIADIGSPDRSHRLFAETERDHGS